MFWSIIRIRNLLGFAKTTLSEKQRKKKRKRKRAREREREREKERERGRKRTEEIGICTPGWQKTIS